MELGAVSAMLPIRDLARARDFYERALALPAGEERIDGDPPTPAARRISLRTPLRALKVQGADAGRSFTTSCHRAHYATTILAPPDA
jgi:catechol 2,3-dioxygenase-like lactoylglutathione lyase family enzyme